MKLPIKLPVKMTQFIGRIARRISYNSPEIMVGTGIVLGGAAIVHGCVSTWKNKDKLKKDFDKFKNAKSGMKEIKERKKAHEEDESVKLISPEQIDIRKKEMVQASKETSKDVVKTWGVTALLFTGSAVLSWKGRGVLRNRLTETTALAAMLSKKLAEQQKKLEEVVGPEKANEIKYGTKKEEVVDIDQDGNKTVHEQWLLDKEGITSPYARLVSEGIWDEANGTWIWKNEEFIPDAMHMLAKVSYIQRTQSDLATARGWMTWGEVAPLLGLIPDPSWFRVGWWASKPGERINIELGVLPGPFQIPFNAAFTDPKNPQNIFIVDPNVMGCIDEVMCHIDKYDRRFGRGKRRRVPSIGEMFGDDMAKKILKR